MIIFPAGMIGIITAIATGTLVLFITATKRRRRRPRHRHQRRHPRSAARQHCGRPGTDLQRDLPNLLQRRRLPNSSPVNFPTAFSLPQIALGYGGLAIGGGTIRGLEELVESAVRIECCGDSLVRPHELAVPVRRIRWANR
jgi:hypothetical protein